MSQSPIPISEDVLELARALNEAGLGWEPQVGSFVWDPLERIQAPSPFPNRVYFVLNIKRFLQIFGSIETMKKELIWIPTSNQLMNVLAKRNIKLEWPRSYDPKKDLISQYRAVLEGLEA
jgi:hypothetical protein